MRRTKTRYSREDQGFVAKVIKLLKKTAYAVFNKSDLGQLGTANMPLLNVFYCL